MARDEECSSKSSGFGDAYKPRVLDYSELDDDCHYLTLREADPIKFKKSSAKKSTLKCLKDLEKEKKRITEEMRALKKKQLPIEVIDLCSDEENTTEQLTQQLPTPKINSPVKQSPARQTLQKDASPESPLKKTVEKSCAQSNLYEKESVTSDEPCAHCKKCRKSKRRKICREEYEIDSSDSYESKLRRKIREREKRKRIAKRNSCNMTRLKRNNESPDKYFSDEHPSKAPFHDVEEAFGDFRCRVCNIEVHSEVTLQTHLVGRKHLKTLKAQAIPEVARQSLEQFSSKPSSCISVDPDGNQPLHYPPPSPGMTRIRVKKIAKLQAVAESYRKQPVTGLAYVTEIHLPNEVVYYCELCDANCAPNTIMCHLIGFKHKLNFFGMKYPKMYERFQYKHKKDIENEMMKLLFDYDKTHGRGLIKVEEEVDDLKLRRRLPLGKKSYSPCRGNCGCKSREVEILGCNEKGRKVADSLVTDDLDVSMNDFFCKVCDSHMNNEQMWEAHVRGRRHLKVCDSHMGTEQVWEAHVRGRRHLKNKKKLPGENPSKIKNIHCPGEKPALMNDLFDVREPVVGLNYIQEVQGRAGNQYKCFLCGACCTSFDVIDHIVSEKHRMKLLEAENKKGKKNGIETILNLSLGLSQSSREKLVAQEAAKFQRDYGKGKMLVYKSKDIFAGRY